MRLVIERHGLMIVPENEVDKAYIEDTLKLCHHGDSVSLRRVNIPEKYYRSEYLECLKTDRGNTEPE